ncbi:YiiX/YebB-like N1pC/P60 family cysteine hydrolase [Cupriavidus basilensis]
MSRPLMIAGAALAGLALGGCATQWGSHADDLNVAAAQGSGLPLRFQQMSLEVSGVEVRPLDIDALQVGDILLSAATSFNSSAIRLATISQVSHSAVYVGGGNVVEAVGSGVRVYPLQQALNDGDIIVAYRHPGLDDDMRLKLHAFAMAQVGQPYNHLGIAMHAPFSLERRLCGTAGCARRGPQRLHAQLQRHPDGAQRAGCAQQLLLLATGARFLPGGRPVADKRGGRRGLAGRPAAYAGRRRALFPGHAQAGLCRAADTSIGLEGRWHIGKPVRGRR